MRAVRTLGGQMILTDRPTKPGDMLDTLLRGLRSAKAAKVRLAVILRADRARVPAYVPRRLTVPVGGGHADRRIAAKFPSIGFPTTLLYTKPRYRLERRR